MKCPFFRYESNGVIVCECAKVKMPTRDIKNNFIHQNCADAWQECRMAQMMEKYYDKLEENTNE